MTKEEQALRDQLLEAKLLGLVNRISKNDFPSVFTMVPARTGEPAANFKGRVAQLKKRAEGLVFDRYEVNCLCEFRVRDECNVMQPCWHPTDLAGSAIEVKELNEFVKKVGPALKATAVVLQVVGVALNLAGIPFPKVSAVTDMISGYVGQAQSYLGQVQGVYDGFEGESDEKVLEKIKKEGAGSLKPKALDGEALVTMKGPFGDTAVSFLSSSFLSFSSSLICSICLCG